MTDREKDSFVHSSYKFRTSIIEFIDSLGFRTRVQAIEALADFTKHLKCKIEEGWQINLEKDGVKTPLKYPQLFP